ncbi:MAG TPA: HRDC domain-containing protein [Acidimicrobiales bacterium]|nr:HRDC domain-containing protein [Acidimicrobiales bacterium]
MSGFEWVDDQSRFDELCEELASEPRYGFDTEFHRERTYRPRLALLQLAWRDQVAVVDPFEVDVAPLARVLAGDGVAIAHAGDQDLEVLDLACGRGPRTLFDTQVVAGFLGFSSPALSRLAHTLLGLSLPKSDRLTDWTRRPLTAAQRDYAAADVAHLLDLHDALVARLADLGRLEWAEQECSEMLARRRQPMPAEEAWWKLRDARQLRGRSRGVAQAVAAWRERRASQLDIPPRFVLPDMALSSIAHRPPRDREELSAVRGIEGRHLGGGVAEQILAAVEEGQSLGPAELRLPTEPSLDRTRRPAVALAAAWVGQLAEDLEIDAGLLATRTDLGLLLSGQPSRLDSGWRRRLVGEPVLRLAAGEAALAFDGKGGLLLEIRSRVPADLSGDGAESPGYPRTAAADGPTDPA